MKKYIFFSADQWKGTKSGEPIFLFTENDKNKVLAYIKANINDFFDGEPTHQKQRFGLN